MNRPTSKSDLEYLYARLDQVRMSGHERLRARAHLERAEAVAALIARASDALGRLGRTLVVRPIRRLAASRG